MTFDVAGRLDQGRGSVSHTQTYVAACHTLGYQQPDLTAHGSQVMAWYAAEDGMDLDALDADCARLRAAATAAEEALRLERDGASTLAAAWDGESALSANDFVDRHCAAATAVVGMLRTAADSCTSLRNTLWRLVDDKVRAAVTIDDRRADARTAWLAASQTVMSGATDRTEAADVVAHQITPYVDADVRTDWVGAMRTTTTSVAAAYDDALHRLNSGQSRHFDVPGQLAPPQPAPPAPIFAPPPAAITIPPAAPVDAAIPPVGPAPSQAPALPNTAGPPPVPQIPMPDTALPAAAGAAPPGVPAMPDVGAGLSGLAGQIADALGGLFAGQPGAPPDPPMPDPIAPDGSAPAEDAQPAADDAKQPDPEADPPEEPAETDALAEEAEPEISVEEPAVDAVQPAEPPPPEPAPPPEPPPAPPPVDESTPCEIAADELPQVGQ